MPTEYDIWGTLLDRILDSPQAERILDSVTDLLDRVGNSVEAAVQPPRPKPPRRRARKPRPIDPLLEHYRALGVSARSSSEDIKRRYRELVRQHHPDNFPEGSQEHRTATETTKRIVHAYREIVRARSPRG